LTRNPVFYLLGLEINSRKGAKAQSEKHFFLSVFFVVRQIVLGLKDQRIKD